MNCFMVDINDASDYNQYRSLLSIMNYSEEEIDSIIAQREKFFIAKNLSIEAAAIDKAGRSHAEENYLRAILIPTDSRLASIPCYDRYIAYLLSNNTSSQVSRILGVSRTSLWRWLKSQGYSPRWTKPPDES